MPSKNIKNLKPMFESEILAVNESPGWENITLHQKSRQANNGQAVVDKEIDTKYEFQRRVSSIE